MAADWTAKDVARALVTRYCDGGSTANLFEFGLTDDDEAGKARRCDLLSIFNSGARPDHPFVGDRVRAQQPDRWRPQAELNSIPSGWRVAFEIKVSKADLRVDQAQARKHAPIKRCVHEFYFVVPETLLNHTETERFGNYEGLGSRGAGLIEVYRDKRPQWSGLLRARITKLAALSLWPETPAEFIAGLVRRAMYGGWARGESALGRFGQSHTLTCPQCLGAGAVPASMVRKSTGDKNEADQQDVLRAPGGGTK